jgi:hypothetical protein
MRRNNSSQSELKAAKIEKPGFVSLELAQIRAFIWRAMKSGKTIF